MIVKRLQAQTAFDTSVLSERHSVEVSWNTNIFYTHLQNRKAHILNQSQSVIISFDLWLQKSALLFDVSQY